ncbi:hypothetical protein ACHAXR_001443 [Thalassiosira sp. AJA248-18]
MPGSMLKKKSNAIRYQFVREGCAQDAWRTACINTHLNVADLMTKPLSGEKQCGATSERFFVTFVIEKREVE